MKKILGMIAILLLCAATARASPPTDRSASAQLGQDTLTDHNTNNVAGSDLELLIRNTAFFMGDENEGLLKGPRQYAIDQLQFRGNPGTATEMDPLGDGKIDAAIFVSIAPRVGRVAVIHSPPPNHCGLIALIAS